MHSVAPQRGARGALHELQHRQYYTASTIQAGRLQAAGSRQAGSGQQAAGSGQQRELESRDVHQVGAQQHDEVEWRRPAAALVPTNNARLVARLALLAMRLVARRLSRNAPRCVPRFYECTRPAVAARALPCRTECWRCSPGKNARLEMLATRCCILCSELVASLDLSLASTTTTSFYECTQILFSVSKARPK